MTADHRLRPLERIQTSSEFRRVFHRGRSFTTESFRAHYLPTRREFSRLGLVVSKKRGKAHDRNRIKRLIRDVFRHRKNALPRSFDVVIIPHGKGPRPHNDYDTSFETFFEYLRRKQTPSERPKVGTRRKPAGRRPGSRPKKTNQPKAES